MSSLLENTAFHYGIGLMQAAVLIAVAFLFLDGTLRLVVLGVAALEVLVTPLILGRALSR